MGERPSGSRPLSCPTRGALSGQGSWERLDLLDEELEIQFPVRPIPRKDWTDPEAIGLMRVGQPVVITGSNLAKPMVDKWTLEYLSTRVNPEAKMLVKRTPGIFMHSDPAKDQCSYDFESRVVWDKMTFADFTQQLETPHRSEGGSREDRLYLQEGLSMEGFGPELAKDTCECNWKWLNEVQRELGFGKLSDNLLLIGERGAVTHCHYDEQHNLYAQLYGRKRAMLISPAHWNKLYPFPVGHAADRQSQVDAYEPNLARYPRFAEVEGVDCVLEPGDILYMPEMWFHMFENKYEPHSMSVTFWFNIVNPDPRSIEVPMRDPRMRCTVRRNLEKFTLQALGGRKAAEFFRKWGRGEELTGEFAATLTKLREMAAMLIDPAESEAFLRELVSSRYDIPVRA